MRASALGFTILHFPRTETQPNMPSIQQLLCLLILLTPIQLTIFAQSSSEIFSCGADEIRDVLRAEAPTYRKTEDRLEEAWSRHARAEQRALPPP